jgi:tetratricopeptide (TPR) repeat protein
MAHDAFISHSSQDKTVADSVCAALEAAGIRCWIAPRDVQPGRSFAGEITRAIRGSQVMVLIFSASTNNSEQVLREVQLAVEAHLHIIQFRIEDVNANDDLKYYLSTPHWLDAMNPPLKGHLDRLVTSIKALLSAAPLSPAATNISQQNPLVTPTSVAAVIPRPNVPVPQTGAKPVGLFIAGAIAIAAVLITSAIWYFAERNQTNVSQTSPATPAAAPTIVATVAPTAASTAIVQASKSPEATAGPAQTDDAKKAASYFESAANRRKKSDLRGALQDYDTGLALDPTNGTAYRMRGITRYQLGDFEGALRDYNRALTLKPNNADAAAAHNDIAIIYRDYDRLAESTAEYDRAIDLDPRPIFYSNRGIVKLLQGDAHGALLDHNKGLELDPNNLVIWENLISFYLQTRRWTEAIDAVQKVNALDRRKETYGKLLIWVADSHQRMVALADEKLNDSEKNRGSEGGDDWNNKIADFLLGKMAAKDFLDMKSDKIKNNRQRQCQIWYFAGMKNLAHSDKSTAIACLTQAIATDARTAYEYRLAQAELKFLGK